MTWHRIDDPENPAPRDGTRFLAFSPKSNRPAKVIFWESDDEGWAEEDPYGETYGIHEPTHWQPLPEPPENDT